MIFQLLLVVVGLTLLLGGGDLLVRGASALAKSWGIPPIMIGLTVVAFGTSAPELSVNLLAAFQGNSDISFGNIVGSNIANIGLILGLSALIRPLSIQGVIVSREIPMVLLASLLTLVTGMDVFLRDSPNVFDRPEGLTHLLLFCVFLYYTIGEVIRKKSPDPLIQEAEELAEKVSIRNTLYHLFLFVLGLTLLIGGGKITVDAAVVVAELLGVPRVVIGLTVIAVGTSLPELVTSGVATWKGKTEIAIGNVVGSNIFNLLFVNGVCATVHPIPIPPSEGGYDLTMMVLLSLVLLPLAISHDRKLVRWEGALILLAYISYSIWRVM